eukprot:scaffold4.g4631.t1
MPVVWTGSRRPPAAHPHTPRRRPLDTSHALPHCAGVRVLPGPGIGARRRSQALCTRRPRQPLASQQQDAGAGAAEADRDAPLPRQPPPAAAGKIIPHYEANKEEWEPLPELELVYEEPSALAKACTNVKLAFALPWRRFKQGSALVIKLSGAIPEQPQPRFGGADASLPALCEALRKAAYDPRISGVVIKELRRHIEFFRQSGKFTIAYLERAGEKEYYLASACEELYAPPSAYLSLRGLSVGVEPQVKRIGKFKSAGDQLLRRDMSDAQREQLEALLDDIYATFVADVAKSRGKTPEEVEAMLNEGIYDMREYMAGGWVTDLRYEHELEMTLMCRTGGKEDEAATVPLKRYQRVVGVVRASGAISAGGGASSSGITSTSVIKELRRLKKDKKVAAIVLRVDSPGGDALASDLMWHEIRQARTAGACMQWLSFLAMEKPVVASMADVAASGGYYMAMGAMKVVAEALTVTGSIGVITGKFNLSELYQRAGFGKETISKGRFAELMVENRPFTPEEEALFDASAEHAYRSFRDKAAESRGMTPDAMQEVAQGRVWSGRAAAGVGLVDAVGGISRAIQLAKQAAGIPQAEAVTLLEVSKASPSPLQLLAGGAAAGGGAAGGLRWAATLGLLLQGLLGGGAPGAAGGAAPSAAAAVGAPLLLELAAAASLAGTAGQGSELEAAGQLASSLAAGHALALMPSVRVEGAGSAAAAAGATFPETALPSPWVGRSGGGLFGDC